MDDEKVAKQLAVLEKVKDIGYFKSFSPYHYSTYSNRLKKPFEFLEEVGIEKVTELVQHGFCITKICQLLGISVFVFRRWMQSDPYYESEIQSAEEFSADHLVYKAEKAIKSADSESRFDITKKVELAKHYRWAASKLNKKKYGRQVEEKQINNGQQVIYNIDLGGKKTTDTTVIDVEPISVKKNKDNVFGISENVG